MVYLNDAVHIYTDLKWSNDLKQDTIIILYFSTEAVLCMPLQSALTH